MKRIVVYSLLFIYLISTTLFVVNAEGIPAKMESASNETKALGLKLGDYILLGNYNDAPILWRYVADDNNGMLMLSDRILCLKSFDVGGDNTSGSHGRKEVRVEYGSNYWKDSNIRSWLNSAAKAGDVVWLCGNPPNKSSSYASGYADEKGFLADGNFTSSERLLIKEVAQRTLLDRTDSVLATSGSADGWNKFSYGLGIEALDHYDEVCAEEVTDRMFLLDINQVGGLYKNKDVLGDYYYALPTQATVERIVDWAPLYGDKPSADKTLEYYLRSPVDGTHGSKNMLPNYGYSLAMIKRGAYGSYSIYISIATPQSGPRYGIRPAFYLDTDNTQILSGSGTSDDPYVIDGKKKDGIAVFCNGLELQLDQSPVMENDRVLVPMRKILEELGAEVNWDGDTKTVTAVKGGVTITMQIDNPIMTKNTESIELDVPPRLVGDRTLVPIRAVAEGLGAQVEWVDELNMVKITTVE